MCLSSKFTGPETRSPHSASALLHAVQAGKEDPGGRLWLLLFQGRQGQRHHRRSTTLGYTTPLPWWWILQPQSMRRMILRHIFNLTLHYRTTFTAENAFSSFLLLFFLCVCVFTIYCILCSETALQEGVCDCSNFALILCPINTDIYIDSLAL